MRILSTELFEKELEWYVKLKKGEGYISEKIILLCDNHRLSNTPEITLEILDSIINFLTNIFKDFSIEVSEQDVEDMKEYFKGNKPYYYSIKQYIIIEIEKILEKKVK